MEKPVKHRICAVEPGSIAEELELEQGDYLLAVNDIPVNDIFDYQFLINDTELVLLVEKADGEEWELEIEKEYSEDLGLTFANGLMDEYKRCSNKCIFCFIDQMPPGMRETLYFKDDDSRLSFLQGNYVTLTNLKEEDVDRIIRYRMEPINISVHTTDPALRCRMLNNRFAGEALKIMDRFYEAEITMNLQIVLCKGINDAEQLRRTVTDLSRYIPAARSLSVVPVGLTKFRDGLEPLESFTKEDCRNVIGLIEELQKEFYTKYGIHFVHASDEFYLTAELPLPEEERYDGYLQLENGVGMTRLFENEVLLAMQEIALSGDYSGEKHREVSVATGKLMEPILVGLAAKIEAEFPNLTIHVFGITNEFFGEKITVSGLITGTDLMNQLKGKELGDELCLPVNMLRSGEEVFLDDVTVTQTEKALQVPVRIVKSSGSNYLRALLGLDEDTDASFVFDAYELQE